MWVWLQTHLNEISENQLVSLVQILPGQRQEGGPTSWCYAQEA